MTNYFKHTLYSTIAGLAMLAGVQSAQAKDADHTPTVVLDPGHGMANRSPGVYDPGCVYAGVNEADLNLDISKRVGQLLQAKGIKVVYTRADKEKPTPLEARAKLANKLKADAYVSIHCNASPSHNAKGIQSYYKEDKNNDLSRYVYGKLAINLAKEGYSPKGKVVPGDFAVLRTNKSPAVLIEPGFLDNVVDREYLTKDTETVARGIAGGIERYVLGHSTMQSPKTKPAVEPQKTPTPKTPTYTNDDQTLLAKMLFGESRSCSADEKIAMAFTAVNRVNNGKKTLHDVLLEPNQYKCFQATGDAKAAMDNPQLYEPDAWLLCQSIANNVLGGKLKDPTDGATFFVGKKSNPDWLKNLTQVFVNNAVHNFYKDNRGQSKT